jgi:hypothetical protein
MTVHCRLCNHEWVLTMPRMPVAFDRFLEAMRDYAAVGCPECSAHSRDVLVGTASSRPAPAARRVSVGASNLN